MSRASLFFVVWRARAPRRRFVSVFGSGLAVVTLAGAGALVGVGAGAVAGASKTTSTTCSSAPTKCYLVTVTPASVKAGTKTAFTFSLTDKAPQQKLGSIKVSAPATPAGFSITTAGVTGPAGSTWTATTTTVVFRTLDITPGSTKTVTIPATAPCGTGTYTWTTTARQSNQFNGPPGNFMVLTTASTVGGHVSGSCTVKFINEPKGTLVGKSISTTFDNTPTGTPIRVGVYSTTTLLTSFSGTVTMSLVGGPGGVPLSGTTVVRHSGATAQFTFGSLSIGTPGIGYQLEARSATLAAVAPVYSKSFAVYQALTKCSTGQCSGSAKSSTVTLSSTATNSTPTGFLGLGFASLPGFTNVTSCGSYKIGVQKDTASFEVLNKTGTPTKTSGTWQVVVEISKTIVQTKKLHRTSPNSWEICYASTTKFTTATGTTATTSFTVSTLTTSPVTTYYYGLLPACSNTPVSPCVLSKTKDGAGDVLITFLATGDPAGRF